MPFLVGRHAYDRLAAEMSQTSGFPVVLCPLAHEANLPAGPVILHALPVARALGEAASRTVIVNADPAHLPVLMETQPIALVTKAAMAVWRVEPENAASAGIWVRRDALATIQTLVSAPRAERAPFLMIAPKQGVDLAQILKGLLMRGEARSW
ncbi:hypothetical protein ACFPB0_13080 [Glycocaulis abyssi]|uniref:Uncharacterized protein n=2 Tax=Glycocaulis abyssi TaxID=1433403 RepID=A0ABV9NCY5_9PROT